jgi:methylmalonyl-CoA mutase
VLGITGTGGSGKSSLTDELIRRFRLDHEDKLSIAVIAVDPTRRRGGGALLGDRIRMNALDPSDRGGAVYFRSLATRTATTVPPGIDDIVAATKAAGADLVIVETPGIGQGDAAVVDHVDRSLYVMTPEFGAASQLEKIDMLDHADVVAINKFDRRGGADALRDVRRQLVRNREDFTVGPEDMPVFGTVASRFNDDGVTALYQCVRDLLADHGLPRPAGGGALVPVTVKESSADTAVLPAGRTRYLAEVAESVRHHHQKVAAQATVARELQQVRAVQALVEGAAPDDPAAARHALDALAEGLEHRLDPEARELLADWPATVRGTVQADILKEDQAQNTCIFSTEFALRSWATCSSSTSSTRRSATSTASASAATTSRRPAPTPSASSPSPWPTASPTWSTTSAGAWTSTPSRPT